MKIDANLKYLSKQYKYLLEQKWGTIGMIEGLAVEMRPIFTHITYLAAIHARMIEIDEHCTALINPKSVVPNKTVIRKPDNLWDETINLIKGSCQEPIQFKTLGNGHRVYFDKPIHISALELSGEIL